MANTEESLSLIIEGTLGTWSRSVIGYGPNSVAVTIPFELRKHLRLVPGVSVAHVNRVYNHALLIELFAQPEDAKTGLILPAPAKAARLNSARGFTLVELMIVVALVIVTAAFLVPKLTGRNDSQLVLTEISARLKERRASARHLAPKTARVSTAGFNQPPVTIDFKRLDTTRPLRVDGTDADEDSVDDVTGLPLTRYDSSADRWNYAYEGTPLSLPTGWRVVTPPSPIQASGVTKGLPAFAVGFDAQGRPWADTDGDGTLDATPSSLTSATAPTNEAKFWAVYVTNGSDTVAVAVHGTGFIEAWRLTPQGWRGFRNRTP